MSDDDGATRRGDMEAQLISLYGERERLARELGTADPRQIIAMIRSLEEQLVSLYRERAADGAAPPLDRGDPERG